MASIIKLKPDEIRQIWRCRPCKKTMNYVSAPGGISHICHKCGGPQIYLRTEMHMDNAIKFAKRIVSIVASRKPPATFLPGTPINHAAITSVFELKPGERLP